jgi:hypothetical protein
VLGSCRSAPRSERQSRCREQLLVSAHSSFSSNARLAMVGAAVRCSRPVPELPKAGPLRPRSSSRIVWALVWKNVRVDGLRELLSRPRKGLLTQSRTRGASLRRGVPELPARSGATGAHRIETAAMNGLRAHPAWIRCGTPFQREHRRPAELPAPFQSLPRDSSSLVLPFFEPLAQPRSCAKEQCSDCRLASPQNHGHLRGPQLLDCRKEQNMPLSPGQSLHFA